MAGSFNVAFTWLLSKNVSDRAVAPKILTVAASGCSPSRRYPPTAKGENMGPPYGARHDGSKLLL